MVNDTYTYTCLSGYEPTEQFVNNTVTTCRPDLAWSLYPPVSCKSKFFVESTKEKCTQPCQSYKPQNFNIFGISAFYIIFNKL